MDAQATPLSPFLRSFLEKDPTLAPVFEGKSTFWVNPGRLPFAQADPLCRDTVSDGDIEDARRRLERFAPLLERVFPETAPAGGRIESPLVPIPRMREALAGIPGRLLLKLDSHLPIAGSVKARGGIYEVLKHAETLALDAGLLHPGDSYARLADPDLRAFFARHTIQVGSTGNLGLSIGISGAALGFHVKVHMSADARQWKKDLLRRKGAQVLEYESDYSAAVAEGRRLSALDPMSYFIDDEHSKDLFLGYAAGAAGLLAQLEAMEIPVDEEHPLLVYIPAGVGGAPGGLSYGLKRLCGDRVHCFFTEPVECPSVLLGIATGLHEEADVRKFGRSGRTEADGLACPSPSGFVTRLMAPLLSGDFTVEDGRLYDWLRLLEQTEGIRIEPSACACFAGPTGLASRPDFLQAAGLNEERLRHATHVVWATGGGLVPEEVFREYLQTRLP